MCINKKDIFLYIGVFFFLVMSGTVCGFVLNGAILAPLFLVYSIVLFRITRSQFERSAVLYCFLYMFCMLVSFFFVGSHLPSDFNGLVGYMLLVVGALCILQSMPYDKFKRMYLNVVVVVALTSIALYLLHQFGLIPYKVVYKGHAPYMIYLFNVFGWIQSFNRLAGPYWEPGAFQVVLSYALLLYFNEISSFELKKEEKKKLLVVVVAIIMTKSTAGYICLFILALVLLLNLKLSRKNFVRNILVGAMVALGCFALLTSDTYTKKLNQKGYENSSYEIRKMDNLSMLQMSIESPFWGYGVFSNECRHRGAYLGDSTSSNGLLFMSSRLGIVFLLCYIFALYVEMKKIFPKRTQLLLVYALLLQAFEVFFYFPLSFVFFFCKKNDACEYKQQERLL